MRLVGSVLVRNRRGGCTLTIAVIASFWATGVGFAAPAGRPQRTHPIAVAAFRESRLVSYRVGEHSRFDRVVFVFSGGLPGRTARHAKGVTADASGRPVMLEGRAFLRVTLMGLDWTFPNVPPEPTLTPRMAVLRQMKPAGVFEGYFAFGLGLSYRTSYHFCVLHWPDRLVLDLDRRVLTSNN
jgi:hypothetical protein